MVAEKVVSNESFPPQFAKVFFNPYSFFSPSKVGMSKCRAFRPEMKTRLGKLAFYVSAGFGIFCPSILLSLSLSSCETKYVVKFFSQSVSKPCTYP